MELAMFIESERDIIERKINENHALICRLADKIDSLHDNYDRLLGSWFVSPKKLESVKREIIFYKKLKEMAGEHKEVLRSQFSRL